MVLMELFGMNGSGKTTTILELEKQCNIDLPITDIEGYSYVKRNLYKTWKVMIVVFSDLPFSIRLLFWMWKKHKWTWDTIATWFNLCHRGYFYLYEKERPVVLGGGILHKLWGTYGFFPITETEQEEIFAILDHFGCEGAYYLEVSKETVLQRNKGRGKNTFLERRLEELDFLYSNYHIFVEIVNKMIPLKAIDVQELESRVRFLITDCKVLEERRVVAKDVSWACKENRRQIVESAYCVNNPS